MRRRASPRPQGDVVPSLGARDRDAAGVLEAELQKLPHASSCFLRNTLQDECNQSLRALHIKPDIECFVKRYVRGKALGDRYRACFLYKHLSEAKDVLRAVLTGNNAWRIAQITANLHNASQAKVLRVYAVFCVSASPLSLMEGDHEGTDLAMLELQLMDKETWRRFQNQE